MHNYNLNQIRLYILTPLTIILAVLLTTIIVTAYLTYEHTIGDAMVDLQRQSQDLYLDAINEDAKVLTGFLRYIKQDGEIQNAWLTQNREALLSASIKHYRLFNNKFDVSHFYFHDTDKMNFLRVHHAQRYGDEIKRQTLQLAITNQDMAYGVELGTFGRFVLRTVEPWYIDGKLVGYVELGKEIEHINRKIARILGIDVAIGIFKSLINQLDWEEYIRSLGLSGNWHEQQEIVLMDSTSAHNQVYFSDMIGQITENTMLTEFHAANSHLHGMSIPIFDVNRKDVGYMLLLHDATRQTEDLLQYIYTVIIFGLLLITGIWLFYFVYVGKIQKHVVTAYRDLEKEIEQHQHTQRLLESHQQELEMSNRELESYSYSIAHDLRTPLRSVVSFSQIIKQDAAEKLSSDEQSTLQRVIDAGKYMAHLIDDILELSRISRMEIRKETVNISKLADAVFEQVQNSEPDRKVEWIVQSDLTVSGDVRLLRLLLSNLLTNAWKYTAKAAQAQIEFACTIDANQKIFYVKDNGIGFDMQHADNLFRPFHRLHRSNEYPGSGVGLATVQRITHRHGGKVWANASPGKGATIYFTLG